MDNQFGETNFMQPSTPEALNAYDVGAEYGRGLLDVPHKLSIAPVFQLPFGVRLSSIIAIESGFIVPVASSTNNTNLFTRMQRANQTAADPNTSGDREQRILGQWLTPAGDAVPAAFTFGTAPRTDGGVRGPHRNNIDVAVAKSVGLSARLRGELRLEVLNLTNTVKVIGPIHTVGSSGFG
jgi:hypothetical protein